MEKYRPPYQTGLMTAVIVFLGCMVVAWLAPILEFVRINERMYWTAVVFLSLFPAVFSGLLAWARVHISDLRDRVTELEYEIDKLKKQK